MSPITEKLAEMLEFPCNYPLKVMGITDPTLESEVIRVLQSIIPNDYHTSTKPSKAGKYTSVSVNLRLENKEQLEAVYSQLNQHPLVKIIL